MALDLTLTIKADATQAKRELASVEQGIKKVESAAKGTQDPLAKATRGLSDLTGGTDKLTKSTGLAHDATAEQMTAWVLATNKAEMLAKEQAKLTTATSGLTAVTGLSSAAMVAYAAAAGVVVVGATAMAAVLAKSTIHYFKHSEATKDSRRALEDLGKSWEIFQMTVGGAVLGQDFSIVKPISALNAGLLLTGAYIAARIEETRMWLGLLSSIAAAMPGGNIVTGLTGGFGGMFSAPSNRFIATAGAPVPVLPETLASLAGGPAAYVAAQDKAKRDAEQAARAARQVRNFYAGVGQSSIPGFPGGVGTQVPIGDPFQLTGTAPYWMPPTWNNNLTDIDAAMSGTAFGYGRPPAGAPVYWNNNLTDIDAAISGRAFQGGPSGFNRAYGMGMQGMSLVQGGMQTYQAASQGGWKGVGSGALTGMQVGMMFGPIGAGIGAAAGAIIGGIKALMAPTAYDLRVRKEAEDKTSATKLLAAPGLESMWNMMGGNVPFGFDFLKTQAIHDPTAVKGYLDEMVTKTERLHAAMEKYGISWEQLGDKAQQSHIDQMAKTLIDDFEVLTLAGADTNFVLEKMAGSANEFVQAALRTGSEVPAAMKPMLEQMIELGLLTDENGDAFESLEDTGLAFAKTMTQGFDSIAKSIEHLALALGYVPDELDAIANSARDAGRAIEDIPDIPNIRDSSQDNPDFEQAHSGGFWWGGRVIPSYHGGGSVGSSLALLQNGEFVMSRSAVSRYGLGTMHAMNSGRGAGGGLTVNVTYSDPVFANDHTSTARFAGKVADATVQELRRRGIRLPSL